MAVRTAATEIAADQRDEPLVDVTRSELNPVRTTLVHVHVPKLADVGLVRWDREAGTIALADHPAFDHPFVTAVLDAVADGAVRDQPLGALAGSREALDDVLDAVAPARSRHVLSVLAGADDPKARPNLARDVLEREREPGATDRPSSTVSTATAADEATSTENLLATLHHVHVPKLVAAGLVTEDDHAGTLAITELGETVNRLVSPEHDPAARLAAHADRSTADIGTIEGREAVVSHGQTLFEFADDELFLMFTTEGLLEAGCLARLRDAVDRGVDVYLGSQTPAVRDRVRERVPGAVIWEPQLDWLNLYPKRERVGRLVFADRTAVMLATLGDRDDGRHAETAITGYGLDDPLVVLLRDILGSRLDHLDAQSEDVQSQIPL